jgi:hypothetical protein
VLYLVSSSTWSSVSCRGERIRGRVCKGGTANWLINFVAWAEGRKEGRNGSVVEMKHEPFFPRIQERSLGGSNERNADG